MEGARLWTHGYDFYSPTRPWIGTWYGAEKGNKGSWHTSPEDLKYAQERLMTLLKWPSSDQSTEAYHKMKGFTLGKRRSLEAYGKFSGIDTQTLTKFPKKCAKRFVPWDNNDDVYTEYAKFQQTKTRLRGHSSISNQPEVESAPDKRGTPHKPPGVKTNSMFSQSDNVHSHKGHLEPKQLDGTLEFFLKILLGSVTMILLFFWCIWKALASARLDKKL